MQIHKIHEINPRNQRFYDKIPVSFNERPYICYMGEANGFSKSKSEILPVMQDYLFYYSPSNESNKNRTE